ncbi:hypothetical protein BGZ47_006340 [Haplosporangium gracile]|nr:hypothetical protein BGZ47_006340 [Haplosporangium gracile]
MEINPAVTFRHDRSVMHAKCPKVLIAGAGLGGLSLGILLHKAGIPFEIFERAAEVKPLGKSSCWTTHVEFRHCLELNNRPFLRQIGVWDEFHDASKRMEAIQVANEKREVEFTMYGADARIISRQELYSILLKQVSKEYFHLGKKVLSTQQGNNRVIINCSDGAEYQGNILVGADGAYSAVRQNMYDQLKKKKASPSSDGLPLPFTTVCLVGETHPLTTTQFPDLAKEDTQFFNTLSHEKPYSVCPPSAYLAQP